MRVIRCDGSPRAVDELTDAIVAALDGGEPVLPLAPDADPAPFAPDRPVEDSTAVIVATSGSTGAPKGVLLSAAALRASAAATHDRLGGPGRWLLALPAHHVAGVAVIVRSVLAGTRPALLDTRGGFRAETFTGHGARYTSLVPTQLVRLLDAGTPSLRSFHAVLLGGATTPPVLRARAERAGVRLVTTYGMSETAGGCVYDGVPLDGVRVRVAPDGRIELGGATLTHGYRGETAFRAGWFRTGDLGRLGTDGRLEVLGRADDVIVTGGEKVAPAAVERALLAQPGVTGACVVGVPDPEWGAVVVAVVAMVAAGTTADALRAAVRAELGAPATPRLLRLVDALPQRGVGKPDRDAVRRLLAEPDGTWGPWHSRGGQ